MFDLLDSKLRFSYFVISAIMRHFDYEIFQENIVLQYFNYIIIRSLEL